VVRRSSQNDRTILPTVSQRKDSLFDFLGYLLHVRHYWAAANVVSVLFHLDHVDCEGVWHLIRPFLQERSSSDDEPAILSRLSILQTFMEGVLDWGLENVMDLDNCSIPSWRQCLVSIDDLRELLERSSGTEAWQTSHAYRRLQILNLDKEIYGRSTHRQQRNEDDSIFNLLSEVEAQADHARDNRVLEGILWRSKVLLENKDPESIDRPNDTVAVPFRMYSRYHALTHMIPEASKYPDSLPSPVRSQQDDYVSHGSSSSFAPKYLRSLDTSGKYFLT
jgi:hypothetical protein